MQPFALYLKDIKKYIFIPSGETFRALEIAILVAVGLALTQISDFTEWRTYISALGVAAVNAAVAFIKGQIPPSKPIPKE